MTEFTAILNSIVTQRFGIQIPSLPACHASNQSLIEKDIVYGSVDNREGDGVGRLVWKLRRWKALRWKREMVFNESDIRLCLASLTSHAAKPLSIMHKM